jgi:hypothetical protein
MELSDYLVVLKVVSHTFDDVCDRLLEGSVDNYISAIEKKTPFDHDNRNNIHMVDHWENKRVSKGTGVIVREAKNDTRNKGVSYPSTVEQWSRTGRLKPENAYAIDFMNLTQNAWRGAKTDEFLLSGVERHFRKMRL